MPHTDMMKTRLDFLEMDQDTRAHLQHAKRILEPALDEMLDRFYAHILKEPRLKALFVDQDSIDRARTAQRHHWAQNLFSGDYGDGYFRNAERIGHAHARVGLTPDWYIGAYCQMLVQFVERISEQASESGSSAEPIIQAVCKAIFLDLDLVIQCYLDAKDSVMRDILRRATDFAADISALDDQLVAAIDEVKTAADETLREAEACVQQTAQVQHDLRVAEEQLRSAGPGTGSATGRGSEDPGSVDRLQTATSGVRKLSERADVNVKRIEQLVASAKGLREQGQQLHRRLDELQFRDKLYIDETVADSGTMGRLKALLWRNK